MERRTVGIWPELRTRLKFAWSKRATMFSQYAHLSVFKDFNRKYTGPISDIQAELELAWSERDWIPNCAPCSEASRGAQQVFQGSCDGREPTESMPEESLLKLDIAVSWRSDEESPVCSLGFPLSGHFERIVLRTASPRVRNS